MYWFLDVIQLQNKQYIVTYKVLNFQQRRSLNKKIVFRLDVWYSSHLASHINSIHIYS